MYDTLITHKPGTAELVPGLAESWSNDPTGKIWDEVWGHTGKG